MGKNKVLLIGLLLAQGGGMGIFMVNVEGVPGLHVEDNYLCLHLLSLHPANTVAIAL